jgi:hypothetical protein
MSQPRMTYIKMDKIRKGAAGSIALKKEMALASCNVYYDS